MRYIKKGSLEEAALQIGIALTRPERSMLLLEGGMFSILAKTMHGEICLIK